MAPGNYPKLHRCRVCGQIKVAVTSLDEWNTLAGYELPDTCDDCKNENKSNDILLGGGISILLDKYYKRNIKISFKYGREKHELYYTIMMAPNRQWMEKKIKESIVEMEKFGLKKVDIKMIGDFMEMENYEITSYMNDRETTYLRLGRNATIVLPLMLKNYATAKGESRDWNKFFGYLSVAWYVFACMVFIALIFGNIFGSAFTWKNLLWLPLLFLNIHYGINAFKKLTNRD